MGASEGLTIPFALSAGLSQVEVSSQVILVAGFVATLAGAFAMSIGGSSAQREMLPGSNTHDHASHDIEPSPKRIGPVENLGLPTNVTHEIRTATLHEKAAWEKEVHSTTTPDFNAQSIFMVSVFISIAYILGGLVPLFPYYMISDQQEALILSACLALPSLFIAGIIKSKYIGQKPVETGARLSITAALAALAAVAVANIF